MIKGQTGSGLPDYNPPGYDLHGSIPRHIGIIMDGNSRWARRQGVSCNKGHLEGLSTAKRIVKAASDLGLPYLTLYTFSTENWKRSAEEVGFILGLVKQYLRAEFGFSKENRIRLRYAGNKDGLPEDIVKEIDDISKDTKDFDGLQVNLAINYGGRDEIVRALKKFQSSPEAKDGGILTEETLQKYLDNPDIPDPDLIIRTAGEFRTSNFLLWEGAYSEYYISEKLWPDWNKEDLEMAIANYKNRERRFGAAPEQTIKDHE